jgi:uncharacterized protein YlzI (FlbEa/FlbD family)
LLLAMIVLTSTDGRPIKINPKDIVSLRLPPQGSDHLSKDAHCLVFMSDGKYIGVHETCDQVNSKLP